ncbi:hypothetical protein BG006_003982 [Podila minutissima]|uniref:FAD-binding domain-containing protein n=1 Tax=Podila minutissima TaxID=64525 RepID=A0A9P5VR99_9FUNG|nr:hypothetical protein BG006_003982 [Podila minutissima]
MASTHRPSSSRESTINSTHSTSSHSFPASCEKSTVTKATVIIVGSGIGGLTLAALLERAGIEYQIFERAAKVKPLGSALSIGPNIMYLFGQLGILDEILANAKPFGFSTGYNLQRQATRTLDYSPAEKIDILVGADGAYSSVRQNLYKALNAKGKLPKADNADLPFNSVCLVGQTMPLDPEEFPHLKDSHTWFETMVGQDKPYAWGPEAAEAMCKEVSDFPVARNNMTLGDLFNRTPKDMISKVMLEEKLFDTWHGNRIVLLGDACHKMFPSAGLGAVSAMQDAVTLANCLYELSQYPSTAEISKAFKHYQNERYPFAKNAYDTSHRLAGVVGTNWYNHMFRTVMKWMPKSLFTKSLVVMYSYRPQASFLKYIPDKGQIKPAPQPSLDRARARVRADLAKAKARAI